MVTIHTLDTLGVDEIALKKGHRDFVVIMTARLKNGRIVLLGVLENRQKETVVEFLRSIPERLKRSIISACCDMYEGFTEAIREELPHVRLVIDRFHVARAYRDGLDSLRKAELKSLKRELSQQEYKALKGSMWAKAGFDTRRTKNAKTSLPSFPELESSLLIAKSPDSHL